MCNKRAFGIGAFWKTLVSGFGRHIPIILRFCAQLLCVEQLPEQKCAIFSSSSCWERTNHWACFFRWLIVVGVSCRAKPGAGLQQHFRQVGEVVHASIFLDKDTGQPKGRCRFSFGPLEISVPFRKNLQLAGFWPYLSVAQLGIIPKTIEAMAL